ncbi:uracil-DNA glycosylase family protein [Crocinitomicaceae bacterium]|nr:uracil-DNA glycosylase family protein [Crocinitomicaceae bacterium]
MESLLHDIQKCTICKDHLPNDPLPVVRASANSKILVVGQAPGRLVHESGIPWNDPSGNRLRDWLQVDRNLFYNPDVFALVPMGFCYPGTGTSGDYPPRKECAPQWHEQLTEAMPEIQLTLLIGAYAQKYYLGKEMKKNLTETVRATHEYYPKFVALPHPSTRNNIWMKKHPWFETEVLPLLRAGTQEILPSSD